MTVAEALKALKAFKRYLQAARFEILNKILTFPVTHLIHLLNIILSSDFQKNESLCFKLYFSKKKVQQNQIATKYIQLKINSTQILNLNA